MSMWKASCRMKVGSGVAGNTKGSGELYSNGTTVFCPVAIALPYGVNASVPASFGLTTKQKIRVSELPDSVNCLIMHGSDTLT